MLEKVRSEKLQKILLEDILLQKTVAGLKQQKIHTFGQLFEKVREAPVDSELSESLSQNFSQQIVFVAIDSSDEGFSAHARCA